MNRIAELNWIEFGVRFETGSFDKGVDCDCEMVGLVGKTGLYMLRWIVDVSESGGNRRLLLFVLLLGSNMLILFVAIRSF